MPPLNWCGYYESRRSGSDTPTSVRSSMARARDRAGDMPRWISTVSVSCRPTESTGFNDVIGSWKTMPISRPRILRISSSETASRSRPLKRIWPPTIRPAGCATRRITDSALTDLPQPDSPTSATVSPALTSQETPSTARTTPAPVRNWVWRFLTSRRVSATLPSPRRPIVLQVSTRRSPGRRGRTGAPPRGSPARGPDAGSSGRGQGEVEGVEVAEAPPRRDAAHRAVQDQRHPLLGDAAVRAERGVQPGEVVLGDRGPDDGVALGHRDQVAQAIRRQLE